MQKIENKMHNNLNLDDNITNNENSNSNNSNNNINDNDNDEMLILSNIIKYYKVQNNKKKTIKSILSSIINNIKNRCNNCSLLESYEQNSIVVLNNINLSIKENEIFGLLGPNGAGKTTLCKIISGYINPSHGTIKFHNEKKDNSYELISNKYKHNYLNNYFGICPQ
eukprot:jgi/Orpsp1_1/1185894/evm.model.c7180000095900.1